MRLTAFTAIIFGFSQLLVCQEFRSTTTVTSVSQPVTVDLSNVSDVRGASISIHNSSSSTITLPQISTPNNSMPFSGAAVLKQLNSLPPMSTDQERAIRAWQYIVQRMSHFCYAGNTTAVTYDPLILINGFGFGCCEQSAYVLAWIWQQEGYPVRLAALSGFHSVPEIFYDSAWHMLDPDHEVYYLKDDGNIAAVEELVANPDLVTRTSDAEGKDPVGWSAAQMAELYVDTSQTLQYFPGVSSTSAPVTLHHGETLTFNSENLQDTAAFYAAGTFMAPSGANSAVYDWNVAFSDASWSRLATTASGVGVFTDANGSKFLSNTGNGQGFIVYREASPFPVLNLTLRAQITTPSFGLLQASFSQDGIHWSAPVPFQNTVSDSAFDLKADLSHLAVGVYSYFVKVQLNAGMQLHRLRISPAVQTSRSLFPPLAIASPNTLLYQDSSPSSQARLLKVTTSIPSGKPEIKGIRAESLVAESPTSSLARDYGAANLVDGDPDSLAYPGASHLDYVIQLNGSYDVTSVSIDWGYFGSDSRYVQSWQILGRSGNQVWQLMASGGFPGQATMDVLLNTTVTELRLVADSANWIGAYDVRVFGSTSESALATSSWTVQSNVTEDPIYSIGKHYGAQNLIDTNQNTLAYPGAPQIDYQISLGAASRLSGMNIFWGTFGSNPIYIQSWSLLAKNGPGQDWVTLGGGGFPNSTSTKVNTDFVGTDLRLIAHSSNWIGAYELGITGGQLMQGLSVTSNVLEQTENRSFRPASFLIDGDENSFAYPGNVSADYTIDPGQTSYFDAVRIVWGTFGTDPAYIQSWRLFGLESNGAWGVIARGNYPNSADTTIPVKNSYRKLRIAADGPNWVGIYEVQAFGTAMSSNGGLTAISNVPEAPKFSIAQNHTASNLIDGDPSTLAYPGSSHIDYQVSLGSPTQLSGMAIDWGYFGQDPVYVQKWSILARNGANQAWTTLATGGFPNSAISTVTLDFVATDVRILADSSNWIGIYELSLNGSPLK